MPGHLEPLREVLEEAVQEHHPRDVDLTRPDRGHLPVEDRDRGEVPVEHVADAAVAPVEDGGPVVGPVGVEPRERPLDQRVRHVLARPLVVRALRLELRDHRRSSRGHRRHEREVGVVRVDAVHLGEDGHRVADERGRARPARRPSASRRRRRAGCRRARRRRCGPSRGSACRATTGPSRASGTPGPGPRSAPARDPCNRVASPGRRSRRPGRRRDSGRGGPRAARRGRPGG